MRQRIETQTSDEIIKLIQDLFSDEDELENFDKFVEYNNDKDKAKSIKIDMCKLLSHNM